MQCLLYEKKTFFVSKDFHQYKNYNISNFYIPMSLLPICSKESEDKESKKQKFCRCGAGVEERPNMCDTPGFPLSEEPKIVHDLRGFDRMELPRNHKRIVASSKWLLQGWRANCDIQVLLYNCDPLCPDPDEIARVTDYIVAYACKGNDYCRREETNESLNLRLPRGFWKYQ